MKKNNLIQFGDSVATSDPNYLGQFIPLHYHHYMLLDDYRMTAFKTAIDRAVFPGAKVLDLGGGTGVLSWFAAAKASKVWCVEYNPELIREAQRLLKLNHCSKKVKLVQADAFNYLPPEPVDIVICEMLHSGMLREKQVAVINSFKTRYLQRFGGALPQFIPEAVIMAVQPVEQNYRFEGFHAPIIQFQRPGTIYTDSRELAPPQVYSTIDFTQTVSDEFNWHGTFIMEQTGPVNALRFITKNILNISTEDHSIIDWHNHHLILPLTKPIQAKAGNRLHLEFNYRAGGSLTHLQDAIHATLK